MKASWLFDKHPIVVDTKIATALGLNEAIVLQQLNYWLHSKSAKEINGKYWVYNTYDNWKKDNFPFWSINTIRRAISKLKKSGIVLTGNFNKAGFDNTRWYSIDETKLNELMSRRSAQNEQTVCPKWVDGEAQNGQTNTRDYPETTSENKYNSASDDAHAPEPSSQLEQWQKDFETVWAKYPKKRGKKQAWSHYKAWRKASKKHTNAYISHKLDLYIARLEREHTDPQFIQNGSTWFNGSFDDEEEVSMPKQEYGGFNQDMFANNNDSSMYDDDLPF
ncbi:hypothetical protein [Lactobacillus hominis]|uniref:Replication protein n=1 Tax=Lactobacillus hominis DSM 23910 = CRBIP 24.179 TaxID=1423758 RepID=I7L5S3_9LACO|nr:hypothetical protein [Lactobacillus hominis]KRM85867.1 hypothetical protein FC41_GL000057 [Lactobacillus hominis DSM 23910 = CRBIP 24.179]MCT3348896.1 hypothetical protein [Lactobacillus hominis]CCI81582.1 Putative uncharacterized protein [Lactobacillus hominis DSM 23910 = CRBIP 24.179]